MAMWDPCYCGVCGENNTIRDCDCRVCEDCDKREAKPGSEGCSVCRGTCEVCGDDCPVGVKLCRECAGDRKEVEAAE